MKESVAAATPSNEEVVGSSFGFPQDYSIRAINNALTHVEKMG
ncbi:hypothetical protein ACFQZT_19725 [Paenibacillus sp. GCM10027628]